MNTKDIKLYLNGARHINRQLKILEKALENIVENEVNIVPVYGKEYIDTSAISNPTEQVALRTEDIKAKIYRKRELYTAIIFDRIELIDNALPLSSVRNTILKERYINSLSWNNISKEYLYNYKYLMRLHSSAIKIITKYVNLSDAWSKKISEEKI